MDETITMRSSIIRRRRLGTLFDAALVQLGWWVCVLAAARDAFLIGPAVVAVLLLVQTWTLPAALRRLTWIHIVLVGAAGTAVDSLQSGLGTLSFAGSPAGGLAPLWITALWCQFVTVVPAFAFLRSHLWAAGLLGGVGGPAAYAAGARFDAAVLHPEPWISLLSLGLVWALALPLMIRAARPLFSKTQEVPA